MDVLVRHAKPVRADTTKPLRPGAHHAAIVFHDAFVSVCDNALPELARRRIPSTLFVPCGYLGRRAEWIDDEEHPDYAEVVLDVDRLKSLDSELVCVGSHGVTHSDLSALSEREARDELTRSRLELEAILKRPVTLCAFPYGRYREPIIEWSKQAGYQRIFTIQPELAFSEPDEYVTGSCSVSSGDWELEFKLKLLGAYHWLPPLYRSKEKLALALKKWTSRTSHGTSTSKETFDHR